jgi:hypothetical protein
MEIGDYVEIKVHNPKESADAEFVAKILDINLGRNSAYIERVSGALDGQQEWWVFSNFNEL